jgi:hypothetical protein
LDAVKDRLILAVCALAMRALKFMKSKHTKKTSAFVKVPIQSAPLAQQ